MRQDNLYSKVDVWNITITILGIINRPVFYLNRDRDKDLTNSSRTMDSVRNCDSYMYNVPSSQTYGCLETGRSTLIPYKHRGFSSLSTEDE
jgi:hypothetical protein